MYSYFANISFGRKYDNQHMSKQSSQPTRILSDINNQSNQEIFLGKGSFAEVYKLTQNGKTYAVKKIPKILITRQLREKQLMREIEILRKVSQENIVNFVDFRDDDKKYFIIKMEYCEGTNLRKFLLSEEYGKLSRQKAKYYATRICLDYIHALAEVRSKMVANRDIKPDNIIIQVDAKTGKVKAKMIDFGEATFNINQAMTHTGTNGYMAPEIYFRVGNYTEACDLWSLGQTIYQIFEGVRPGSLEQQYLGSPFKQNFNPKSEKDFQHYYEHLINQGINLTKSRTPGPFRAIIRGLLNLISEERMTFAEMLDVLDRRFIQISECLESQSQRAYQHERIHQSMIKQKQTSFRKQKIKKNLQKIEQIFNLYKQIVEKLPKMEKSNENQAQIEKEVKMLKTKYKDISKLAIILVRQVSNNMNQIVDIMDVEFDCLFQEILVGIINKEEFEEMWKVADRIMNVLGSVGEYSFERITSDIQDFVFAHFKPKANTILNLIHRILNN